MKFEIAYKIIRSTSKVGVLNSLVYRWDFLMSLASGLMNFLVQLIFWPVFYGADTLNKTTVSNATIAGYNLNEIISYSVLVYILQFGIATVAIGNVIKSDIMNGDLNINLIRPFNYLCYRLVLAFSQQLFVFLISVIAFLLISGLLNVTIILPKKCYIVFLFILSILLSYVLSFLLSCMVGMLAFWMLETSSLDILYKGIMLIMSGSIFPLDYIGGIAGFIIRYLPFSYMVYFPVKLFLGSFSIYKLLMDFLIGILWATILFIAVIKMWQNGIKRFSAFGD